MKYEPCSGRCYAPGDVFRMTGFGAAVHEMTELLQKLVRIHEPACGNEQIVYGMDLDEDRGVFISSFQHYGRLDLFTGANAFEALSKLADAALAYYDSDEWREDSAANPGLGHNVCEHGKDSDLVNFALEHSGLPAETRAEIAARMTAQT